MIPGICNICGKVVLLHTCSLCGQRVCHEHFNHERGACVSCARGKV